MTDAEVLAINRGLALAQGWTNLRDDGQGVTPQGYVDEIPDPFTQPYDFVRLFAWALREKGVIVQSALCLHPQSAPDYWVTAKTFSGRLTDTVSARSQDCGGDVKALLRAVTPAIWQAVREDETTKGEEKP